MESKIEITAKVLRVLIIAACLYLIGLTAGRYFSFGQIDLTSIIFSILVLSQVINY